MTPKLAIISALAGIALGLRYKVLTLIRAVVLVILFTMIVGIARGDRFLSIALAMAIAGAGIQVGYLVGTQIRVIVDDRLT